MVVWVRIQKFELDIVFSKIWPFVVLCGYPFKNQRDLELKIILSIENDEEQKYHVKMDNQNKD